MIKNFLKNGLAKGKTVEDFCPVALKEGTDVEMEHTKDRKIAERIAMDHLTEDPHYYKKLKMIEGKDNMKGIKELMAKGRKISDGPYKDAKLSLAKELQKVMGDEQASGMKKGISPGKEILDNDGSPAMGQKSESPVESRDESDSQMAEGAEEAEEEVKEGEQSEDQSRSEEDPTSKLAELEKEIAELKAMLSSK